MGVIYVNIRRLFGGPCLVRFGISRKNVLDARFTRQAILLQASPGDRTSVSAFPALLVRPIHYCWNKLFHLSTQKPWFLFQGSREAISQFDKYTYTVVSPLILIVLFFPIRMYCTLTSKSPRDKQEHSHSTQIFYSLNKRLIHRILYPLHCI